MYRYYMKSEVTGGSDQNTKMAATSESAKVRNLESSILFLQQGHADTLKCLHDEIRALQKKNSELTFRLEMAPVVSNPTDTLLEDRVRSLTLEVDSRKNQQESVLHEKEERISVLEKQVKQQEKTFREELKTYSSKFRKFQQDLTSKADTIAELQLKLYSTSTDLAARRSSDTQARMLPTPPKEGAPRVRRGSRKMIEVKAIPNDRPLSSGLRREFVIDHTPFLIREGSPADGLQKRQHEPLPPINPQERTQSPLLRRPEAEVVELALSRVPRSESWRPAPSHGNFE